MKQNLINKIFASLLLGLFLSTSYAQSPLGWEQLSANEQKVLAAYKNEWQKMNAEDQLRLQRTARNWQQMAPSQRKLIQQRAEQWRNFSETEKEKIRQRYQQFEKMSPEQKQKIIQRMNQYQALPQQERETLRHRWQQQVQQQHKLHDEQLQQKQIENMTSTNEEPAANKLQEKIQADEQSEKPADSRLDNSNRIRNNRLDTNRINRPTRRTR